MLGVIANQRFLGHTNPIMTAGVGDGGSVQDREYIQRAARGIVDAGHWGNLTCWLDAGLVKLRSSGGVDYLPKIYDIGSNGNNSTQATEAYQPILSSTRLKFDGTNITTSAIIPTGGAVTFMAWINPISTPTGSPPFLDNYIYRTNELASPARVIQFFQRGTLSYIPAFRIETVNGARVINGATTLSNGTWYHVVGTYNGTRTYIYVNGTSEGAETVTTGSGNISTDLTSAVFGGNIFTGRESHEYLNDFRIYNIALSDAEVLAIYNQTSYRYA